MQHKYKQNKFKTILSRVRYFGALLKNRILNTTNPVICVLVVNNHCNFRCKYCFGEYHSRKIRDYTTAELLGLIDDLYDMGTRYINMHGGETLLRKDIGILVDHVKSKGMYCCVITNGALLERKLDELRNVDNLTISLDGRRENNDKNRGEGTHDIALNAIKLALANKIPLRVSATITKHTMNDVDYMANLAKDLGFTVHFSILFKPLPNAKDCEMTNAEVEKSINLMLEYKKMGYPIFTSERVAKYARDWPLEHNEWHFVREKDKGVLPPGFKHIPCFYGRNKITIEADGKVYPCFLLEGAFDALDWREAGIRKAAEHARKANDCITCPAMTQNDHNLLLGLDMGQVSRLIIDQIKESFRRG